MVYFAGRHIVQDGTETSARRFFHGRLPSDYAGVTTLIDDDGDGDDDDDDDDEDDGDDEDDDDDDEEYIS